jgi:hypothetical protein
VGVDSTSGIIRLDLTYIARAYSKEGVAWHDYVGQEALHPFQKGSKITFVLNLTCDCTLVASVDGHSTVKLFSNMRSSEFNDFIFIPAVSRVGESSLESF